MPRRRGPSAPPQGASVSKPQFLSRLDEGARAIVVDACDRERHLCLRADGEVESREGPAPGLDHVREREPLVGVAPPEAGFDRLFRGHLNYFDPEFGRVEDCYEVFRAWAYAQVLRPYMPFRPVALFTGPPGSSKTTTAAAVAQLWFGLDASTARPTRVPEKQRDFASIALAPFILFDNVETPQAWLPDSLCLASDTSAKLQGRKLYTDDAPHEVIADAVFALSSFSARGFVRGDVLSRFLIFRLKTITGYMPMGEWRQRVADNRLGFWRHAVQVASRVHRRWQAQDYGGDVPDALRADRLQDFLRIGRAIAYEIGGRAAAWRFVRGMAAMSLARFQTALSDPDLEALATLAALTLDDGGPESWHTSTDLVRRCAELAGGEKTFDLTLRSAEAFGRWLSNLTVKGPGVLRIDRRLLDGRTRWRVRLPDHLERMALLLTGAAPTNGTNGHVLLPAPPPALALPQEATQEPPGAAFEL